MPKTMTSQGNIFDPPTPSAETKASDDDFSGWSSASSDKTAEHHVKHACAHRLPHFAQESTKDASVFTTKEEATKNLEQLNAWRNNQHQVIENSEEQTEKHDAAIEPLEQTVGTLDREVPIAQTVTNQPDGSRDKNDLKATQSVEDLSAALKNASPDEIRRVLSKLDGLEKTVNAMKSATEESYPQFREYTTKNLHSFFAFLNKLEPNLDPHEAAYSNLSKWKDDVVRILLTKLDKCEEDIKDLQSTQHLAPALKDILEEGKTLGDTLSSYQRKVEEAQLATGIDKARLNKVDRTLASHREKLDDVLKRTAKVENSMNQNKKVGDVVAGTHNNQANILKQLENMRSTQRILSVGFGVLGLFSLGYLGYVTIPAIIERIRSRMKGNGTGKTGAPKMAGVGRKKKSHARDFKVDEDVHMRAIF